MIIIIVLLILLACTLALAFFLPSGEQEDQAATNQPQAAPQSTIDPTIRKIATDYITYMASNNYHQAYDLFAPNVELGEDKNVSREWFVGTVAPAFVATYQVDRCVIREVDPPVANQLQIVCPFVDTNETLVNTYIFDTSQAAPVISAIQITGVEQL